MKKLGLIGGTGPESTLLYYRAIEKSVQEQMGKPFFPRMTIESLSVFDVLHYCEEKDYDGLTAYLLQGFGSLAAAGCDFAALTGITPHIVIDRLKERSPIPIVSMIDTAADETERRGWRKVGLLGTTPTMRGSFFQSAFAARGIDAVRPAEDEMQFIGNSIETELEYGKVMPATRRHINAIIERMRRDDGIQAAVLGCTELPLLYRDSACPIDTIDVMEIHIRRLVRIIMEEEEIS